MANDNQLFENQNVHGQGSAIPKIVKCKNVLRENIQMPAPCLEFSTTKELKPSPRNARTHSKKQIRQIADSIQEFGFNNPILVDAKFEVIAGHGRLEAAKLIGLQEVPVVRLDHLSDLQRRAYVLADNKIALNAGLDRELLSLELGELADLPPEFNLDLEITGFETGEIDLLLTDFEGAGSNLDKEDQIPEIRNDTVSMTGDVWQMGSHRVLCGDARNKEAIERLLQDNIPRLVITDPPYNVKVQGHVGGHGKTKHTEFAFASGEMTETKYEEFLHNSLRVMAAVVTDGCLLYVFIDWRHVEVLLSVGRKLGLSLKNLCVWNKSTPGQGSFYRSAHELVAVFLKPGAPSTNNVQLGKFGRNRPNVWTYPGVNTFKAGESDELTLHSTVKPMAMIADAIKDASKRGEVEFDPFLGSGKTLLAAEKVGRSCCGVEYEPAYVDVIITRWQEATGKDAVLVHRETGENDSHTGVDDCYDKLLACASTSDGELS